ncbi:hypothetical protein [Crocosphaera sp. Alani8]
MVTELSSVMVTGMGAAIAFDKILAQVHDWYQRVVKETAWSQC